jgi:hypothetical protein
MHIPFIDEPFYLSTKLVFYLLTFSTAFSTLSSKSLSPDFFIKNLGTN